MKPELGVCYYPEHWPQDTWARDAERMVKTGLKWVRIGEFAWSRLEQFEGVFTWDWLDQAVETLGAAGLEVVMGTPSATPPRWVLDKYPDMLAVDAQGQPRKFGSRRHYCFSHLGYRAEAARMAKAMAERYGRNPYVTAWQIDNEYGCHETTVSFSPAALHGFRDWLAQKYQSPQALNTAWGNIFWSMEYDSFDAVDLPNLTVTEANPSHWLDFRRFTSDQVVAFNRAQVAAMRPHTDAPLIHNYMGRVLDFDHFDVGDDLEIASWDSYPMGFLEHVLQEEDDAWKAQYANHGDPDFQGFHHDLYRAVGKGRWWIMEQQPGPVNWAPYNPIPQDGMVKLWSMEAIAHGAEVVSYFRWRQAPFAQEQLHAGLLRPDSVNAQGQIEARAVYDELQILGEIEHVDADVAIVFDYESQWAWEIQPQGKGFDYFRLVFEQYRALRKLGLNVDILPANTTDFGARKLVVIPGLMAWNDDLRGAIERFEGQIIIGPRSGLKTPDMQIPRSLGPDVAGVKTVRVASLRPNVRLPLSAGGHVIRWYEEIEAGHVVETTDQGHNIMCQEGHVSYLAAWLDQDAYLRIFEGLCAEAGIVIEILPDGLRKRSTKDQALYFNYSNVPVTHGDMELASGSYLWVET
ncbi:MULTISPECIES: beta-galactosidase [Pacificibacter]|uniref:beta-galactosidase n=1 Tax=Pacificibacter TaxID=1042323 RepID=UPI001C091C4B|nr:MULTISPECIES: beta-galactosidase [Pacificibacter]MBU2935488.1 beta-galactosidase [Pacificibacter marinus]MDO6613985.1 beta-galactosidase [Pacificibacter sp. 1_MG-2023]